MVVEIVDVVATVALADSRKGLRALADPRKGLARLAPTLGARGLEFDRELI